MEFLEGGCNVASETAIAIYATLKWMTLCLHTVPVTAVN